MNLPEEFQNLCDVIAVLRGENGCPWDLAQTPQSMRSDLYEEVCETLDAINEGDVNHIKEELGDVLLNALMISYMYQQRGNFTISDVLHELTEKLIRRHPHVFADSTGKTQMQQTVSTPQEVLTQWDSIKKHVEGRRTTMILDEVPKGFHPLLKAYKLQKKAAKQGFDWKKSDEVKEKIYEELHEVSDALYAFKHVDENSGLREKAKSDLEGEIGDVFFALVNYARHLKIDPSLALQQSNAKFYARFCYVEQKMKELNLPLNDSQTEQMNLFWDEAKKIEQNPFP